MKNIKVRFNLGRGKNYMKWKVTYPTGVIEYHDPNQVQLMMVNCRLKNRKNIAEKIKEGAHKEICAWVLCDGLEVIKPEEGKIPSSKLEIKYNPRLQPNWVLEGANINNSHINIIVSVGKKLYIKF
jgi:hypothetical protein